ncbi:MAG: PorT family protein [Bacteroidaceae bacterium]|nr:PorT family protein [Bacteroidaceae bacterium]
MKRYILSLITGLSVWTLSAQEHRRETFIKSLLHNWEYEVITGFQIGGMAPIPLPREIREIEHYSPTLLPGIEGRMTKWLDKDKRWGMTTGIGIANKGMSTRAQVKSYSMEIIGNDNSRLKGSWTGKVQTKVRNTYLTFPLSAVYKLRPTFHIQSGFYFSYLLKGKFHGKVYEGYLRKDTPTGDKISFDNGATALYDFSDKLRRFQWGIQVGADWQAFKQIKIHGNLTWGLNDIFHSHFQTISFPMYPVFLHIGIGYVLK